ncbi:MAG: hypothetical protein HDS06_06815 [Bacteroides sp.]|nr:hypothetical protein [Bacteroides sp.]
MEILNLIIGAAAGFAGGYAVKSQASKSESLSSSGQPFSLLYNESLQEISKLKSQLRSKDSEIDDLNQRIKSLTRKIRDNEDADMDKADNLSDMKRTIESLRRQNDNLNEKMNDYKSLYEAAQQEIERLKA